MNIEITKMNLSDLELIKSSLEKEFDNFWNYNIFKQELQNKNSKYFIAKSNTQIIGFIGFMEIIDEADITNIVVHKDYRNQGIAYKLLETTLTKITNNKKIKVITLEVNETNIYAIKLYKRFGFKKIGIRKNYYPNHTNAIIMSIAKGDGAIWQ